MLQLKLDLFVQVISSFRSQYPFTENPRYLKFSIKHPGAGKHGLLRNLAEIRTNITNNVNSTDLETQFIAMLDESEEKFIDSAKFWSLVEETNTNMISCLHETQILVNYFYIGFGAVPGELNATEWDRRAVNCDNAVRASGLLWDSVVAKSELAHTVDKALFSLTLDESNVASMRKTLRYGGFLSISVQNPLLQRHPRHPNPLHPLRFQHLPATKRNRRVPLPFRRLHQPEFLAEIENNEFPKSNAAGIADAVY